MVYIRSTFGHLQVHGLITNRGIEVCLIWKLEGLLDELVLQSLKVMFSVPHLLLVSLSYLSVCLEFLFS